jgi:hypothetical protein
MIEITNKDHKIIASKIVNDFFLKKYIPTIDKNKSWYKNLSNFVVKEWSEVSNIEIESKFDEDDEEEISKEVFFILMDKLEIDEDEYEDYEDQIDWGRFEEIIGYYICCL